MARQLTKELARKIVRKLKAKKGPSGAHQLFDVLDGDGTLILSISVRHGSEKDKGHDHLQDELHVNTHQAKCLAYCTLSKENWIQSLIQGGHYARPDDEANH
jgi:hypothetical protein